MSGRRAAVMSGRHAAPLSGRHAAVPRFARRPSRLTLKIIAAALAACVVGGVAGTLSAGSGAGPATGGLAAVNRADASGAPGAAGSAGALGNAGPAGAPGGVRQIHWGLASGRRTARQGEVGRATKPYLMYDSVMPSTIPSGNVIATYATGPFAVPAASVAGHQVLWIDTNATDPSADILDVEPGDATPQQAATWAQQKLSANPKALARIYTSLGEWSATQAAVGVLPATMRSRVRWWIADPTGAPHVLPGSDATQWYWGSSYDISTVSPRF